MKVLTELARLALALRAEVEDESRSKEERAAKYADLSYIGYAMSLVGEVYKITEDEKCAAMKEAGWPVEEIDAALAVVKAQDKLADLRPKGTKREDMN